MTDSDALVPAVEIGGTHVSAAVVDLDAGRVLERTRSRRPLDAGGTAAAIIAAILDASVSVASMPGPNAVLGVAIPGPFDYSRGVGCYEDVAKFEKEAKSKGPVAGFAQETVPVLQKHLQTAQSLTPGKQSSK